jgi:hypothetical protein
MALKTNNSMKLVLFISQLLSRKLLNLPKNAKEQRKPETYLFILLSWFLVEMELFSTFGSVSNLKPKSPFSLDRVVRL